MLDLLRNDTFLIAYFSEKIIGIMTLSTLFQTANQLKLILFLAIFLASQSMVSGQCGDLYIAGVFDGPLSGGTPKGVLFCANANIPDLSIYGFGSANNGGGTDGEEFTFPAAALNAGECVWVASETPNFNTWFGFDPCYTSGSAEINGDDAIELFCGGSVVDLFGDILTDGTGECWDHLDGWATNNNTAQNNGVFNCMNYTFSGINALDGDDTNATATTGYPTPAQTCPVQECSITNVNVTDDGACSGDDATYTVCADVSGGSGDYDLVDTGNTNTVLSSLTAQADGMICFAVTITGPTTASTLSVDVLDNVDPTCIGGTPVDVIIPACPITTCTITNVTVTVDGSCSGDDASYIVCADVIAGSGDYDLVDIGNANAVLSTLSAQPDGNICFNVTIPGPTTAASLSVDVLDNSDPTCIGGTAVTVSIPTCPVVGADIYISEISYNPCTDQGADGDCEYIILTNAGSAAVDISGFTISNGITFTFPTGTTIPAGGTISLGSSANCSAFNFDLSPFSGALTNTSETIELNDAAGANIFTVTYDNSIANGDCNAVCVDAAGSISECPSSLDTGVMCPDLSAAAPPAVVTDSTCPSGSSASGGSIAMPVTMCPTNSTLEYSEDGLNWSQALPIYLQNGPAQSVLTRCVCDSDIAMTSPASTVVTSPGSCDGCGASISTFPANGN